jgi:hypothetical protein
MKIISPKDGDGISMYEDIEIIVSATTEKGSILQVQLFVDTMPPQSRTNRPYNFTIPAGTLSVGFHPISVIAYSSRQIQEGESIYIEIKNE